MVRYGRIWAILLTGILVLGVPTRGQKTNRLIFEQKSLNGYNLQRIDWENRRVTVTAIGTYPPQQAMRSGGKEIRAENQAEWFAREKLLQAIYGVFITGNHSISMHFSEGEARLLTAGILRDAQVVGHPQKSDLFEDGTFIYRVQMTAPMPRPGDLIKSTKEWQETQFQIAQEIRRIRRELGATGRFASLAVIRPEDLQKRIQDILNDDIRDLKKEKAPATAVNTRYTALIIDLRHVRNARASMLPRILDESNRRVLGLEDLQDATLQNGDLVKYASSIQAACNLPEAGSKPLKIKALRVRPSNPGHIVVSNQDAEKIMGAHAQNAFLSNGRVILVL